MANNLYILNEKYSTTRLCYKLLDDKYLDEKGKIRDDLKFKIDIPEFEIKNSKVIPKPEDKFETLLFLPKGEGRKGEGGLRTKGYFKFSYEKTDNNEWWLINSNNKKIKKVELSTTKLSTNYYPLISIITVVYNGEKYLEETIQSIINQTYPNVEYIIIDGGSTDKTLDIIKKYEDSIDYWVSERDNGIYDAMNKGLDLVNGKWIYFIGSDDLLCRDVLEKLKFNEEYIAIYGDVYLPKAHKLYDGRFNNFKLMLKNISHQAIFYNYKVFKKHRFNTKYKIWADYELNMKIFKEKFLYLPILISYFNDIDGTSSIYRDDLFERNRSKLIKDYLGYNYFLIYKINFLIYKIRYITIKTIGCFLDFIKLKKYVKRWLYKQR